MSCQSRFNARYWMLGAGAVGRYRGMVWGGRREEGSGWGTHVYLWRIHFDIWQNQYNIVKLKNKIKFKKINKKNRLILKKKKKEIQLSFWAFLFFLSHIFHCYKLLPLHWAFATLWSFPYFFLFSFFNFNFLSLLLFFLHLLFVCFPYCSFPLAVNL